MVIAESKLPYIYWDIAWITKKKSLCSYHKLYMGMQYVHRLTVQKDLFLIFFFFFEGLRNVLQFLTVFKCDVHLRVYFLKNIWHFFLQSNYDLTYYYHCLGCIIQTGWDCDAYMILPIIYIMFPTSKTVHHPVPA